MDYICWVNKIHHFAGIVTRCVTISPTTSCVSLRTSYSAKQWRELIFIMVYLKITIGEENLDNKLRKLLAERQSEGLLTVELVEVTDYVVTPPTKRGTERRRNPQPDEFVRAVKYIVNHAAMQNNQVKNTIENGVSGKYCFWLDAKSWCDTMDKLLEEHRDVIANALEHKYQADSVNLLAPYIGEIIDLGLFQKSRIQKTDLISSFSAYYGKPMSSVQTKLSTSYPEQFAFNDLVGETYKIATKKHK